MNALMRLVLANLCLAVLLVPAAAQAQSEKMVSSEDILRQLEKKPEPAPGASRSFRGIRITGAGETQPAAQAAPQAPSAPQPSAEPTRDVAQTPKEKPAVTVYIYFKSGSAELAGDFSRKQVAAVGKALSAPALAGAKFEIGGHTDSQGSDALNQALSEQRAAHIRDLLVNSYGMQAGNVSAVGYGKNQPVADNDTEAGRAKNRRVVIKRLD
ncbi:MAG: OmpA family protein [Proteobacteria bacterium]|nr:OmpA family protein [Pseudomonadota bacterium]MBU1595400.1 OmpA family protein [Pseudomonadota bacterium]